MKQESAAIPISILGTFLLLLQCFQIDLQREQIGLAPFLLMHITFSTVHWSKGKKASERTKSRLFQWWYVRHDMQTRVWYGFTTRPVAQVLYTRTERIIYVVSTYLIYQVSSWKDNFYMRKSRLCTKNKLMKILEHKIHPECNLFIFLHVVSLSVQLVQVAFYLSTLVWQFSIHTLLMYCCASSL